MERRPGTFLIENREHQAPVLDVAWRTRDDLERGMEVLRTAGHEVELRTDCQRPEGPDVGLADENNTCGSSAPA